MPVLNAAQNVRKVLLFIISVAMVVVGLLMIAFKLLDPTPMPRGMLLFVGGGATLSFLGLYLLWEDFIAPLFGRRYDEVREMRVEQKLATMASENPFRALDPEAFDRGAKINRWADELRRVAAKELTGSDIAVALQTALGDEVAAQVLQKTFSPDQSRYVIDELLNEVCPGVRKAAYMAANLPEPDPYDEGRDLTSEEFHQLTLRIINAATKGNVPVSDAISATAKAMGDIICILAERPGNSAENLVKWGQQAIAEFTQHAIAERAAQRSP
jgi:hypothetical protein